MEFYFCGTNFVTNYVPNLPRILSAFFPLQIHAESTPHFSLFAVVSLGARTWLVCVAALGCQYFSADQRKLGKLTLFVLGTSSDTTQRASTQRLGIFHGKKSTPDPLCACAALNLWCNQSDAGFVTEQPCQSVTIRLCYVPWPFLDANPVFTSMSVHAC